MNRINKYVAYTGLAGSLVLGGCVKPFDKPEYQEVDTAETAFLVPLEGDTASQAKFQSEQYLQERKIAAKRVQITHRWSQTGRWNDEGQWIPDVRLIKVNRSPVTRLWTAEGTAGTSNKDEAIWVESNDSVGFSVGINCTAFIAEDDAAKFLYWYPSGSLAQVMDTEVHGRIQKAAADFCAGYDVYAVRGKKVELGKAIDADVIPFFKNRGITITAIGMYGGFHYENPKIQEAIDNTAIAQQEKVVAAAELEAQADKNSRIKSEAQAQADAKLLGVEAEIKGMREMQEALSTQGQAVVQLKMLEIEKERVTRWNGQYPLYYLGSGSGVGMPNLLMQVPPPPSGAVGSAAK